jgi:hypothetical protein
MKKREINGCNYHDRVIIITWKKVLKSSNNFFKNVPMSNISMLETSEETEKGSTKKL